MHESCTNFMEDIDEASENVNSTLIMPHQIRLATSDDANAIRDIEQSATKKFGSIPELKDLVEGLPPNSLKIQKWLETGRVYLALEQDQPVGFVAAHEMDSAIYIAEISVLSDQHGKGLGMALLQAVFDWARESKAKKSRTARVSLTTYVDVPWNGPWYRRRGFVEVEPEVVGPRHVAKVKYDQEERELERTGYRRCCMLWEEE